MRGSQVRTLNDDILNRKKEKHMKNLNLEDTVRQWVEAVLGVQLNLNEAFGKLFKSGALLCELLNKIRPGLIKKIDSSNSPFKQRDNIQNFLEGCKQLGMPASDLFETVDLFEEKDILNVITTLFVLGQFAATVIGYDGIHLRKPTSRKGSLRRRWKPVKVPSKKNVTEQYQIPQPSVATINIDMVTKQQFKYDPQRQLTARQWIEEVVGQSFPYASFARSLKDGMLLCRLLNKIQPGTVSKINTEDIPFKQMENIESYIRGCVKLGIPAAALFDTTHLFEEKDINSVIDNIHTLAKHVQKNGFQGPQIKSSEQSTPSFYRYEYIPIGEDNSGNNNNNTPTSDEVDIISWANNYLKKRGIPANNITQDFRDGVRLCTLVESVTGIGVGLVVKDPVLPWHAMQNIGLALQAASASGLCEQLVSMTGHAILCGDRSATKDILSLIRGLDVEGSLSTVPVEGRSQKALVEPLNAALQAGTPILKKEEVFSVFGNWEEIWMAHSAIASILEKRCTEPNATTSIADVFIDNSQAFQVIYSTYINNFDGSGARIKRLRRANDKFENLLLKFEKERENTNRLDLGSYLITPIQRLPRYLLLIRQLLECTPESHPDRKRLADTQDRLEKAAAFVNTSKGPPICDASRKFVREGFLQILGMENARSSYFFLLSDMVLYCKYKPGKSEKEFKYKAIFPLSHVLEVNPAQGEDPEDADDGYAGVNNACAFELVTEQFSLILMAETAEEKLNWVRDIKSCLV